MKTIYSADSRFRVIRRAAFAVCISALTAFSGCDEASDVLDEIKDGEDKKEITLGEYFEQINEILYSDTTQVTYNTAKESIQAEADRFQARTRSLLKSSRRMK